MIFFRNRQFESAVKNWLLFKRISVKSSTYYRYKYIVDKYILIYFDSVTIYYFTNFNFENYTQYLSKTLSSKTVQDILNVLKSLLKYIERRYNVDYKLDLISMPKRKQNKVQILKKEERDILEKYCLESGNLKNIGIAVCLNTGMRLGEICALKWEDIELEEGLISVNKTIQRVYLEKGNTKVQIDEPKTKDSIRKIPISNKLINVLKKLKETNHYSDDEYLITGTNKYMEPRSYQRIFKRCLKECNIMHDYKFHVLRHTFATNCVAIGMDIKSLSEILGHSNVSITLNLYVHSSYETQKKYLDKL